MPTHEQNKNNVDRRSFLAASAAGAVAASATASIANAATGKVGDHMVPMPHLGVVLGMETWKTLAQKLTDANLAFVIAPTVRFEGQPGEQSTMFFKDPSGNPIEIKGFADEAGVFAA